MGLSFLNPQFWPFFLCEPKRNLGVLSFPRFELYARLVEIFPRKMEKKVSSGKIVWSLGMAAASAGANDEPSPASSIDSSRSRNSPLFNYPPIPRSSSSVSIVVSPTERRASMPDLSVESVRQVYDLIVSDKTEQNWLIVGINRGIFTFSLPLLFGRTFFL